MLLGVHIRRYKQAAFKLQFNMHDIIHVIEDTFKDTSHHLQMCLFIDFPSHLPAVIQFNSCTPSCKKIVWRDNFLNPV